MKKRVLLAVLVLSVLMFGVGMAVGAAGNEPGSNADPLVSKSYVDEAITKVEKQAGYCSITLSKGKKLSCDAGTKLVVTSGAGKATGTLSDVTQGNSLKSNKAISVNHEYLVTGSQMGIKATQSCKVFVMGQYQIK